VCGLGALLASCTSPVRSGRTAARTPEDIRAEIAALLPPGVSDRAAWAADIQADFATLGIEPSRANACAVVAVIEQESGFRVDPVIPDLGTLAWREIDERASNTGVPRLVVHAALDLRSSDGRTYAERIRAARTERQLSDIFEDFVGRVPMGRTLFADWNPIRTRGPMQVNVAFAKRFESVKPYPYPAKDGIPDVLFTRRGSLYFGIAHLLAYQAPYDRYLYRFADYNAGQYASRNAAFQRAVSIASGMPVKADGALLPHDRSARNAGSTEQALLALGDRLPLSDAEIFSALREGDSRAFEQTALYRRVFALAERKSGHPLPRAVVPHIELRGPKIERALTTDWYAHRVDGRFERCLRE
jgi:hypothetical protein